MPTFEVDFNYTEPAFATVPFIADSLEDAQDQAMNYIMDEYPEALDVQIVRVYEVE